MVKWDRNKFCFFVQNVFHQIIYMRVHFLMIRTHLPKYKKIIFFVLLIWYLHKFDSILISIKTNYDKNYILNCIKLQSRGKAKKSIDEHLKNKKYRSFKKKNVLKHSVYVCWEGERTIDAFIYTSRRVYFFVFRNT